MTPFVPLVSLLLSATASSETFEFWPGARFDPAVPSFEKVFAHAPGEAILSHAEILTYVDALAAAKPDQIRVFEYARSWEGRKLVYAVIGSKANMARLDEIRANRKRLADPRRTSEDEARALIASEPAITWLAYGVHGNEISSPDAGLLTAYHLLAAVDDSMVNQILAETLVVVVPPRIRMDAIGSSISSTSPMGSSPRRIRSRPSTTSPGPGAAPIIIISTSTATGWL
jgi:hypothetical protein